MSKNKKTSDDILADVDPEEDLMRSVRTQRAITQLKVNRYEQAKIDAAIKELSGGEKNFVADISIPEMIALAQALPG